MYVGASLSRLSVLSAGRSEQKQGGDQTTVGHRRSHGQSVSTWLILVQKKLKHNDKWFWLRKDVKSSTSLKIKQHDNCNIVCVYHIIMIDSTA